MAEPVEQKERSSEYKVNSNKPRYESPRVISLTQLAVGQGIGGNQDPTYDGASCSPGAAASACGSGGAAL